MQESAIDELRREAEQFIPAERLISDPLRRLAYGTDASLYRLVPCLVVMVNTEAEVIRLLALCRRLRVPLTFRAAGTSLSGQAITDSVLVVLGDTWRDYAIAPDAGTIRLQPGIVGSSANRFLAPFGRKIGPDPASIDAAKIGGIAANNASGMCCGTRENSYHTLAGMRVVLADGAVLDTNDGGSVAQFRLSHAALLGQLAGLAQEVRGNSGLAARIRHKYRMKNTTGYGINALIDFDDPVDILIHLMIGSEGTLGFISEVTYRTVPDFADKATALMIFPTLEAACTAVIRLRRSPVAAVELMDRAALRSVEHKPGMPENIRELGAEGAALLVETRAEDALALTRQMDECLAAVEGIVMFSPPRFSTDPAECARFWAIRKGTFPSVGAVRDPGTTVLIEDVAFPVPRLAEATLELQALLHRHGYHQAIIFGHALEGNLHFVFTPDFGKPDEVERYRHFMAAVCDMVVNKYDGALKAEHGTGRNMAPFVRLEWGDEAVAVMQRIKMLFDPDGVLNPGVILSDDPEIHLKNLKPMPAADPLIDKCIECGFCEVKCPSHGLTLSPRQRIVGWREVARLEREAGSAEAAAEMRRAYRYPGLETCAACGLCTTACPVEIETGSLIKLLRGQEVGGLGRAVGNLAASQFGAATAASRTLLWMADQAHGLLGTTAMSAIGKGLRQITGDAVPLWTPAMPKATRMPVLSRSTLSSGDRIVYFPACTARTFGPARGDDGAVALPTATERLLRKAGFEPLFPDGLAQLCCGQPFESKGQADAADRKSAQLEAALYEASEGGRLPILFDTSPCSWRMKTFVGSRLNILDLVEGLHDLILPRLNLRPLPGPVALHVVCSVRKMGLEKKLEAIVRACCERVILPEDVQCCGWAGDKGWTTPELSRHALRHLGAAVAECESGVSTSRTCEIGLSFYGGIPYRSVVELVDACSEARSSGVTERHKQALL